MSNSANVTLRQLPNGVNRPLLYEELDANFQELIFVIDEFNAHLNDGSAHVASQVTYDNTASGMGAINVQQAVDELKSQADTNDSNLDDHINDTTAHPASNITYNNAISNLSATNSQAAIDEVDGNLDNHLASSTAHIATEIVYDGTSSGLVANDTQAAIDEVDQNLDDHIDSNSAHDASSIVYDGAASGLVATNSQEAIDEVDQNLEDHINSNTAHDAADLVFDNVYTGSNFVATHIQGALEELETKHYAHLNDTINAHTSGSISYYNGTSGLAATNAQDAIDEVDNRIDVHLASSNAHDAAEIVFDNAYSGSQFVATDLQGALEEIETDHFNHVESTTAHEAEDLVYDNSYSGSTIASTNVQGAIEELETQFVIAESQFGEINITNNTTALAVSAAADSTLQDPADYTQITGVWDATPHGTNVGVTQGTDSFTIGRHGYYKIEFWGAVESDSNNTVIGVKFGVNGVVGLLRSPKSKIATSGEDTLISAHGIIEFQAGDVITLYHASTIAANLTWLDAVLSVNELKTITP